MFPAILPNFEPVSHVKNPNFLEFGEGEEERMEWLERSMLSHTRKNLVLQQFIIEFYTAYIPLKNEWFKEFWGRQAHL